MPRHHRDGVREDDTPAVTPTDDTPTTTPYVRISHPEQRKGGGLTRQTTADLNSFCKKFGFRLAPRILIDDGVSAFEGLNATPNHALGQYLIDARKGIVRPGDCLLLENWDRLSRQNIWAAIGLVNDLRQLGIHIGRLDHMKLLRCDDNDPGDFFEAAVELMRGHSESKVKSLRNGAAWVRKRAKARKSGKVMTRKAPSWIEVGDDGKFHLIPERAAAVKRVFQLASSGYGHYRIIQRLIEEGYAPFTGCEDAVDEDGKKELHHKGRRLGKTKLRAAQGKTFGSGQWTIPFISKLLRDRKTVGEHQPKSKGRKADGPPIAAYYPAAVTEDEFYAAQVAVNTRLKKHGKKKGNRVGRHVNLFAGLLINARDPQDTYVAANKPNRVIVSNASHQGHGGQPHSFQLPVFERAVLSAIHEIDPAMIIGEQQPNETQTLKGQLERVEASIALLNEDLNTHGDSPTLYARLRAKEVEQRELTERLREALQRESHPLGESWSECKTLIEALDQAPDQYDARCRLRVALRMIVESIYVLVVGGSSLYRTCYVQIVFRGGEKHREYAIYVRNGSKKYGPGKWFSTVMDHPSSLLPLTDLRDPTTVECLDGAMNYTHFAGIIDKEGQPLP